ncbi:MAG TPA: YebC/PmpR family DNA-binding transcriptional regulator [Halanaerobiaceae bacterium]|nr:YebC/PmpR family DNA-binding transcriptional regulator [Bacillota bacterium]HHU91973.1 YebC/PmpR family DNA-binding transcriptional regulator [Halanaerobiaceae bacterium]HOA40849.1 YebC/PmpR family DNA-binding transcriptional regulator [Halanaerobiales bacterium]HPZ62958.1 YebC/PmpR family DNA-binding transcriptional regulator [Halanaerobiales bacterium]HQD04137.1 YebC/PmpR family DNA-binding transcriptional regulator [Halanaerobiales bacterium]
MAGHSKWANIKHKKGREDARRGKLFSKLSRMITVAAREGGGDPDTNSELRLVIQKAKDQNMPNDNIERAIKRGTGEISGVNYERFVYEGYGPGGVALYMEMMSDNRNRTASEIRHLLSKYGGNLGETGCVAWMFQRRGQLVVDLDNTGLDEDTLMLMAIEAGADDIVTEGNLVNIYTEAANMEEVRKNLEGEGIEFVSADIAMIPENTIELDADTARKTLKLMDVLEDHDDVQEVYSNFDIPDEIMQEIAEEV